MLRSQRSGSCDTRSLTKHRRGLLPPSSSPAANEVFQRTRRPLHACSAWTQGEAVVGRYLVLLYLSRTTEKNFYPPRVFLVYLKTKDISLYFYFSASFSELSFGWLVTKGEPTLLTSQETTADSPGSQSLTVPDGERAPPPRQVCRWRPRRRQHFWEEFGSTVR